MVCFNGRGRGWREAGRDPRSRCEEAAHGGERTRHPLWMKSWNGQIRVKAGEAKKVLGLKKSRIREEGCWTCEEGSSCAGGFREGSGFHRSALCL